MYSLEVYIKSFGGQKEGSLEPPRTPLPTGLQYNLGYYHFVIMHWLHILCHVMFTMAILIKMAVAIATG